MREPLKVWGNPWKIEGRWGCFLELLSESFLGASIKSYGHFSEFGVHWACSVLLSMLRSSRQADRLVRLFNTQCSAYTLVIFLFFGHNYDFFQKLVIKMVRISPKSMLFAILELITHLSCQMDLVWQDNAFQLQFQNEAFSSNNN